jgi:hypothetical protein
MKSQFVFSAKPNTLILMVVALVSFAACAAPERRQEEGEVREGALAITAPCMADAFGSKLQCTANDVRIAEAESVSITSCREGETIPSFTADFRVVGNVTRHDIGLYFEKGIDTANDGALTGTCEVGTIEGPSPTNSSNFVNLDAPPDTCGDIDSAHSPQVVTLTITGALCQDTDGDGLMNLPNCTSWRQPGSNEVCTSPLDAFPGAPSKCNCNKNFNIPVTVAPEGMVEKSARALVFAAVQYDVAVKNTGSVPLELKALVDDQFGDTTTVQGKVLETGCAVPQTIAAGATYTCSFVGRLDAAPDATSLTHTNVVTGTIADTPADLQTPSNAVEVNVTMTSP